MGNDTAEPLRSHGYGVITVMGNEKARVLLGSIHHYDLFIVGHAAAEAIREEMADWLKREIPEGQNPGFESTGSATVQCRFQRAERPGELAVDGY
ncbi:MAG: hypothetical protein DMG41_04170 [Acidobacteria bacterium]|nr:MAG: hypothetical protein AUH13_29950 [Acidobacteria bacterium 13_2_20CM_58_27]PYT90535.1 MAG: hypothetical protein DMG41_04170 [Acidobacteriota bacterium]